MYSSVIFFAGIAYGISVRKNDRKVYKFHLQKKKRFASLSTQSPVHSGSCVSEMIGILKFGAVWVLQRKIKAMAGEQPENHALRLLNNAEPSAFLRPEGRKPYFLAFALQMTLRVRVYLFNIGKSCLHLCLALLPLYIMDSYCEN